MFGYISTYLIIVIIMTNKFVAT